ncbi:NifU family protein [Govanella unica]|uniref:NifU family protein n=1 Tax=Govanella unica TaxID=2975056 RepID=A0A9X3U0Q8_9PROT|nr:NifU family protein [Govania unica]MDA5194679.1 NifU family protein [Govania unica]
MFIQTEQTPNPATLKFLPGREVLGDRTANFTTAEAAGVSPLAIKLFEVEGVTGVFLGSDFITVTKGEAEWQTLKPVVLGTIMEHFTSGAPILTEDLVSAESGATDAEEDREIIDQIKDLLDTRVRPAVARDGGDIVYHGFQHGVVYLKMHGSCAGCPSSTATLKQGIENLLKHFVPEVTEVRAV